MTYALETLHPENLKISTWTGGTTTELAVYPKESVYADRNFSVRVSTATVELEKSVFTALPGFTRLIMPLSGNMKLAVFCNLNSTPECIPTNSSS
ncbi:MAG: HutD family protein [Clostridiales bacterium]|jgi:environmental stress-induced protein Ves|nr:HutD family protein [Clostridiales bacterium]